MQIMNTPRSAIARILLASLLAVAACLFIVRASARASEPAAAPALAPATSIQPFMLRVIAGALNVRAQPNAQSRRLGTLRGGTIVQPEAFDGVWAQITFRGQKGWINRDYTALVRTVDVETPAAWSSAASPLWVKGSFDIAPFENTLNWRVFDSRGRVVGEGFTTVTADELGGPGRFDFSAAYRVAHNQSGRLALYELSAKDGSVISWKRVPVRLVKNS